MKKVRDKTIDSIKGIAITIVFLRHVIQGGSGDSDSVFIGNIIFAVQMPLFMILSGYFGCKSYREKSIGTKELIGKIKKITIAYMIPFLSFFFIFKVIILQQYTGSIFELMIKILNDITISLWYLFVIWILGCISTLALFVTGKIFNDGINKYYKGIGFVVLYFILLSPWGVFALKISTMFLGAKLILFYSIFYLVGYLIKCFKNEIKEFFEVLNFKEILYAVSLLIFSVITYNVNLLKSEDNLYGILIRFIVAFVGIYVIVYLCYKYRERINNTIFSSIGQYTLEIYYVHSLLVRIMNTDNKEKLFTVIGFSNTLILFILMSIFTTSIKIYPIKPQCKRMRNTC